MNDSTDVDGPVAVGHFPTILEANLVVGRLDAEGIEAEVEPNAAFEIVSYTQLMGHSGGLAVLVPRSQSEKARAVLQELQQERQAMVPAETDVERRSRQTLIMSIVVALAFPLVAPLMFLRIRNVRNEGRALAAPLPPETQRRVHIDLVISTVVSSIGCALCVLSIGLLLYIVNRR
jgi:ABC-type enterochelin transport system permease subunit